MRFNFLYLHHKISHSDNAPLFNNDKISLLTWKTISLKKRENKTEVFPTESKLREETIRPPCGCQSACRCAVCGEIKQENSGGGGVVRWGGPWQPRGCTRVDECLGGKHHCTVRLETLRQSWPRPDTPDHSLIEGESSSRRLGPIKVDIFQSLVLALGKK